MVMTAESDRHLQIDSGHFISTWRTTIILLLDLLVLCEIMHVLLQMLWPCLAMFSSFLLFLPVMAK